MQRTATAPQGRDVRIIHGRFTVEYRGRIDAQLEPTDGCVIISEPSPKCLPKGVDVTDPRDPEGRSYTGAINVFAPSGLKPKNWMPDSSVVVEDSDERLIVEYIRGSRHERLEVYFAAKYDDRELRSEMHGRLVKLGSEREVGDLLERDIDALGEPGLKLVAREFRTSVGPIDLLCEDVEGRATIIELKRHGATPEVVYQTLRYIDALAGHPDFAGRTIRGIIAAPSISKETQRLCAETGIAFRRVRYADLLERRAR